MSEWKKVKIGDIFAIEKGSLQSSKNTPGKYDFITAASEWKNHNSYDHDCEAIVYAVAASGSLGRAHYVNGKFIASDLCFILTEKNKDKYPVNFLFYQIIFEMLRDEIVSKTKTGTSKESINRGNFSNYEIPYFPIDFQLSNYQRFVDAKNTIKTLIDEYEKQKSYAKQLRQNILQEAIEGKLTADWRKQHPVQKGNPDYDAEALLEKIQIEKQEKGKKQKPLPAITEAEKPFAIPSGWKWVRLGEITSLITDGKHGDSVNQSDSGYYFLSAKDIQNGELVYSNARQITKKDFDETHRRTNLEPGDICMVNTGATIGKLALAPDNPKTYKTTFQKSVAVIKLYKNIYNKYIKFFLEYDVSELMAKSWGSAINNLLLSDMRLEVISLPPLAEQKEIVARVEKHLQTITQLETQIATRETTTKQLMQSILKDAFEEK